MSKLPCFDDSATNLDKLLVVVLTLDGALDKKSVPPGAKYEHTLDSWRNLRFTSSLYWSPKKATLRWIWSHWKYLHFALSSFDVNAATSTVFATLCLYGIEHQFWSPELKLKWIFVIQISPQIQILIGKLLKELRILAGSNFLNGHIYIGSRIRMDFRRVVIFVFVFVFLFVFVFVFVCVFVLVFPSLAPYALTPGESAGLLGRSSESLPGGRKWNR